MAGNLGEHENPAGTMLEALTASVQAGTLAQADALTPFLIVIAIVALGMLLWDTIEVGRNDAANLINAVFGARVLSRRAAVYLAGAGVLLGATFSSKVIETARKGIFKPSVLAAQADGPDDALRSALAVYTSVYVVDTVLLYGYSAFGMPVSTTATLVFSLLGASFVLGGYGAVNWGKAGTVILAIFVSILITGVAAFFVQRAVRGAIRERTQNLGALLAHGGWVCGGMLAGLTYFMLVKGMKKLALIKYLNEEVVAAVGPVVVILALWLGYAVIVHVLLLIYGRRAARRLFSTLAILGTLAMAFAFGQNDLANCASPGLAAWNLILNRKEGVAGATEVEIAMWMLSGCGLLMALGMTTRNAQRVTSTAVHSGSMAHQVRLWAPTWCVQVARLLLQFRGRQPTLAPPPKLTASGKTMHYDVLRACVILTVSASVIATASSFGLPVSTTYVAFAAVVATGMADRIFQRGDAELKLARTIWVMFSWFAAAGIATVCAGLICLLIYHLGVVGIGIGLAANLSVRQLLKRRSDAQEARVREAARERRYPERYAEYEDD